MPSQCEFNAENSFNSLQGVLKSQKLNALFVADQADIRRHTGFTGSNALFLLCDDGAVFFTDSRYTLQAKKQVRGAHIVIASDLDLAACKLLGEKACGYAGLEARSVKADRWMRLAGQLNGWSLVDVGAEVSRLRMVKRPDEIAKMREASRLAEDALRQIKGLFREGVSEAHIAREFKVAALRLGAQALSFETIVAGGPNGAMPHAVSGPRELMDGDFVVVDFGVMLDGYMSDQTLTLPIGKPTALMAQVYALVLKAKKNAEKAALPGVAFKDVDFAARQTIADGGYGSFFGHGTGHGVGLEIHEAPSIGPHSKDMACEGMVFTIEPGIYLEGRFGIRLEDTVVLTQSGVDPISLFSKELGAFFDA